MVKRIHGIVHGRTIELNEELGVADGQAVELTVRIVEVAKAWGEGILRSAGPLEGDSTKDDDILAEIAAARKKAAFREMDE